MPETNTELSNKIDSLTESLHGCSIAIMQIDTNVKHLSEDVHKINLKLFHGNGQKSLLTRIDLIEIEDKETTEDVQAIQNEIAKINDICDIVLIEKDKMRGRFFIVGAAIFLAWATLIVDIALSANIGKWLFALTKS